MSTEGDKRVHNTGVYTCYTFPMHFLIESKYIPNNLLHIDRKTRKIVPF